MRPASAVAFGSSADCSPTPAFKTRSRGYQRRLRGPGKRWAARPPGSAGSALCPSDSSSGPTSGVVEKYLTEDESNRLKNEAREPLKREVGDPVMDKHAKLPEGTTLREHLADKQAPRNYKVHDVQSMGDVGEL